MITIDLKSRIPIYEQLKNNIIELVVLDVFKPGEKLPSVRTLAAELGVNPNTIQKSYQDLEKESIVYSLGGRGTFISEKDVIMSAYRKNALKDFLQSLKKLIKSDISADEVKRYVDKTYAAERRQDGGKYD